MAQEVAIQLKFDAGQSIQEAEKIDKVLKSIKKDTDISNVNQQFDKLNKTIDRGGNSAEDLMRAVKSYQTIALTAGRTSPIGKEALQRAANLRDQVIDLDNEVKRLANDHRNLQGAMQIASSVTAGYQAFAGVTALVGDENEELMQTMVKLQAVQSTMNGLMEIRQALEKESSAMMVLMNARQKVMNGLMIAYNFVLKGTNTTLKLFRGALIATGLGAIVVLIGTLVAKWDDWKDTIYETAESILRALVPGLEQLGLVQSEYQKIAQEAREAVAEQITDEIELIKTQRDAIEERYDHEIKLARASGKETWDLEREKLKAVQERVVREAMLLKRLRETDTELTQEQLDRGNELVETLKKTNQDLELLEVKHQKKIQDEKQKSFDKQKAQREKFNQEEINLIKRFEDFAISQIKDEGQRTLEQQELQHQREMQDLIKQYGQKTELIKKLERIQEQERLATINELTQQQKLKDLETEEAESKRLQERREQILQAEIDFNNMMASSVTNIGQDIINTEEAVAEAKRNLLNVSKNVISGVIGLMDDQSKAGKALALSQVAIDTAVGFTNALRIAQQGGLGTGTAAPFTTPIFYATAVGQVLSAVNKAKSILKAGSSVSPPSISSGGGSSSSRNSDNGQLQGNQNTGRTDFVENTQKVVLVDSEVKASLDRNQQIDIVSSI